MPLGTTYKYIDMANTYIQIHIQAVFAVQDRQSLIKNEWKEELYKYITGIIQPHNHKVLQINECQITFISYLGCVQHNRFLS